MAGDSATAIVIRTIEYSETSLIVTLWTKEFGRLTAIAKGARRPKGPFEGSLDLLSVCRVLVIRKSHDALDLLTESKLHRRFRGGERSLSRTYAGYHVAEMLRLLTDDHDPHADLYDLTTQTLGQIDGVGHVPTALVHFDVRALKILGNSPGTDRCTHCGNEVASAKRLPFAFDTGGVVCGECRPLQRQVVLVRSDVIDQLRNIQADQTCSFSPLIDGVYGELRSLLNRYIQSLLGLVPRTQSYLPTTMGTGLDA